VIRSPGIDDLTREGARRAAHHELQDHRYGDAQPPLLLRVLGAVLRRFFALLSRASGGLPGGRVGLVLLALLLAGFVAVVLVRLRPTARQASAPVFTGGRTLTAAEHRALADQAASAGRWDDAVRERLRAVVRELESRGVLDPRPGRTAGEVASEGGTSVPAIAAPLRRATTVFDEVWYGGRTADAAAHDVVVAADHAVTTARLVVA